jgi:hypothetical protein
MRYCIFQSGILFALLQFSFLLVLMLENPGWITEKGQVRFISDALAVHQGYGAILIVCFLGSNAILSMAFVTRSRTQRVMICFLLALPISSGVGVVGFTNIHHIVAHEVSTCLLFVSYFAVLIVTLWTTKVDSIKCFDMTLVGFSLINVCLFICFYFSDVNAKERNVSAVAEVLCIFTFILFNLVAPIRVRDHLVHNTRRTSAIVSV